jgi:DNA binding domain, excisionase family
MLEVKDMEQVERMYSVNEVAEILHVSFRTIYRLMKVGKIQAVRVGRQWRIPKSEIEKYLKVEGKNA